MGVEERNGMYGATLLDDPGGPRNEKNWEENRLEKGRKEDNKIMRY